jgi:hypothetical protein
MAKEGKGRRGGGHGHGDIGHREANSDARAVDAFEATSIRVKMISLPLIKLEISLEISSDDAPRRFSPTETSRLSPHRPFFKKIGRVGWTFLLLRRGLQRR